MLCFIGAPIDAKFPPMRPLWIGSQALLDCGVTPRIAMPLAFKPVLGFKA